MPSRFLPLAGWNQRASQPLLLVGLPFSAVSLRQERGGRYGITWRDAVGPPGSGRQDRCGARVIGASGTLGQAGWAAGVWPLS